MLTLREAAESLQLHLGSAWQPDWLQAVGSAEVGPHNGTARILVYLNRELRPHDGSIPVEWYGFPVVARVVGRVRPRASPL